MCAPVLAAAAIGTSVLGTITSIQGANQAAGAQQQAADYNAQVARNNAVVAQHAAADAMSRGSIAEDAAGQRGAGIQGQQKVAAAANGVDVNAGSPVDLRADAAGGARYDQLTAGYNAAKEAAGDINQSTNFTDQANLDVAQGQNAAAAGRISATSAALQGAGSVSKEWYYMNRPGYSGGF